jgi:Fe2+ or Zn2+ uptake regulation protein
MTELDSILDRLKAKGERVTIQRRIVIESLCKDNAHLTVNDIQRYLQHEFPEQPLSDTTVYRILQWLKDLEFVSQTDMGTMGTVYQLLQHRHHHLICLTCGAEIEMDDDCLVELRQLIHDKYGFKVRLDHLALYGQCHDCL